MTREELCNATVHGERIHFKPIFRKRINAVTKNDLIHELIDRHHAKRQSIAISKADMEAVVDSLGEIVHERLAAGEDVPLPGIGKLSTKERAARTGRNPQTGEAIEIPAKRVPHFSAAKALKDAV